MRIAYVCHWNLSRVDGVSTKIAAQVAHWRREGHEVALHCLSPAPAPTTSEPSLSGSHYVFGSAVERIRQTRSLFADVEALAPDLVYLRYDAFAPPPLHLMRRVPTVLEVNTDDLAELRLRGRVAATYNRLQRPALLRAAAGAVFVTHELAAAPGFRAIRGRRTVIGNGIDEDAIAIGRAPANERRRLVFLGTPVAWQGIDKLLWLAQALPELDFDLIGVRSSAAAGAAPNVRCHGFLTEAEYAGLLERADVGIGTLALHRKGMSEACPLKVRTYLARGLPVVLGHEDTDFVGEEPWFLLRLPNHERNVCEAVERIRSFVAEVAGSRVPAEIVRAHVGSGAKERERLRFFELVRTSRR